MSETNSGTSDLKSQTAEGPIEVLPVTLTSLFALQGSAKMPRVEAQGRPESQACLGFDKPAAKYL